MWGQLLAGIGGSLAGGLLDLKGARDANKANRAEADRQYDLARNSVRYRVEDAKRAGIHPLYALGAPTMSSSFTASQNELSGMGQALSGIGDQYNRALSSLGDLAGFDRKTRQKILFERYKRDVVDTETKIAQRDYWREMAKKTQLHNIMNDPTDPRYSVFKKLSQNKGQNAPRVVPGTEYVLPGGQKIKPKAGETRGQEFEDNYGEAGDSFLSPYYWNNLWRAWRDYYNYD